MKKHSFKGQYTDTLTISGSKAEWVLEKNASIEATAGSQDHGIVESSQSHGNRLIIVGDITASNVALELQGSGTEIIINASAELRASHGAALDGSKQELTNNGTIVAVGTGIIMSGPGSILHNDNQIEGGVYGAFVRGSASGEIINAKYALIHGGSVGVYVDTFAGGTSKTVNHGAIQGIDSWGYQGGAGNDTLINDGTMAGGVYMGAGDDKADMRGTKGSMNVFGSNGSDTLVTDNAEIKLFEFSGADTGYDTVKSSVTFTLGTNVESLILTGSKNINGTASSTNASLVGNSGNNTLTGGDGSDALKGFGGNDELFGGNGVDYFRFSTGWDQDVIHDFQPGIDKIDLLEWKAIKNYHDLMENHATEKNGNVTLKDGHDSLTILDTTLAELPETAFYF